MSFRMSRTVYPKSPYYDLFSQVCYCGLMGIIDVFCQIITEHLRQTFPTELLGLHLFVGIGSYIQQELQDYCINPDILDVPNPTLLQNFLIRYTGFRLEGRQEYQRTYLCNARVAWEQSLFRNPDAAKAVYAVIYYPTYIGLLVKSVIKPFWDIWRYRADSAFQIQI